MTDINQDIAVLGMSGQFPQANNLQELRSLLIKGQDCVRPFSESRRTLMGFDPELKIPETAFLDSIDDFDPDLFNLSTDESISMDPEHRFLLQHTYLAIEDAGYDFSDFDNSRTAVIIGSANPSGFSNRVEMNKVHAMTGTMSALAAGRISYWLNLSGPAEVINTACSSSLYAVLKGMELLNSGVVDYVIAGAFRVIAGAEEVFDHADPLGIESNDNRSRPFDAKAAGIGIGEGGGVVLMRRLSCSAKNGDRVRAVLKGGAAVHDGHSANGLTAPNVLAQKEMYQQAWAKAGIEPSSIGYFEAHGTGTLLGDPIEYKGLLSSLGESKPKSTAAKISSTKSNFGHLDNAAGLLGLFRCVLSLENKELYSTVHFEQVNPHMGYDPGRLCVSDKHEEWLSDSTRMASVSSFGLSGTNVHIVLAEPECEKKSEAEESGASYYTLNVSGRNNEQLVQYAHLLADHIEQSKDDLSAIARTLNTGRHSWPHRLIIGGHQRSDLCAALRQANSSTKGECVGAVLLLGSNLDWDEEFTSHFLKLPEVSDFISKIIPLEKAELATVETKVLLQQLALVEYWAHHGITFTGIVATGIGRISKEVIAGTLSLNAALEKIKSKDYEVKPVDQAKLKSAIENFEQSGPHVYVDVGISGELRELLLADLIPIERLEYMKGEPGDGFTSLLRQLNSGIALNYNATGTHSNITRVQLPSLSLLTQSCWPEPINSAKANVALATSGTGDPIFSVNSWQPIPFSPGEKEHAHTSILMIDLAADQSNKSIENALLDKWSSLQIAYHADEENLPGEPSVIDWTDYGQVQHYLTDFFRDSSSNLVVLCDELIASQTHGSVETELAESKRLIKIYLNIAKVLIQLDGKSQLVHISTGSTSFTAPDENKHYSLRSTVRGLEKVIAEENPKKIQTLHVDLTDSLHRKELSEPAISQLLKMICRDVSGYRCLCILGHKVFHDVVLTLPSSQSNATDDLSALRKNGNYLITGGLGGLGREIATLLVSQYDANVCIVGRREASEVEESDREFLKQLNEKREQVFLAKCDISSVDQVTELNSFLEECFEGPVNGVFHCAGLPGGGFLREKYFEQVFDTLAPKVEGTLNICNHLNISDVDFILLMSSLTTRLPAFGQADYCGANIFLEDFSSQQTTARQLPLISIAWSRWKNTGMAANNIHETVNSAITGIDPQVAIEAIKTALVLRHPVLMVSEETPEMMLKAAQSSLNQLNNTSRSIPLPKRSEMEKEFIELALNVLPIDEIALEDDFYDLGASSLEMIALYEYVENKYPGYISIQSLLEDPSIQCLMDAFFPDDHSKEDDSKVSSIILNL